MVVPLAGRREPVLVVTLVVGSNGGCVVVVVVLVVVVEASVRIRSGGSWPRSGTPAMATPNPAPTTSSSTSAHR